MPFQKGHKKAGGRQKGTPNKSSAIVEALASKYKYDPLEILMMFAQGDWEGLGYDSEVYHMEKADGASSMGFVITPHMRMKAAAEVAQYLHAKKKERPDMDDEPIDVMSIEEKKQFLKSAEQELQKLREEINAVQELESSSDPEDI